MTIFACNRELSSLQLRSMRLFGANVLVIVGLTATVHHVFESGHPAPALAWLLAVLPAVPVAGIVAVVGRYLRHEVDEFIRAVVVQSLLWGLGITMVVDTVFGLALQYYSHRPVQLLNVDLFLVSAMVALRVQLWRNA